jgi:hypothetical protein
MNSGALEVVLLGDGLIGLSLENVVRDDEIQITGIHLQLVSSIDLQDSTGCHRKARQDSTRQETESKRREERRAQEGGRDHLRNEAVFVGDEVVV